MNLQNIVQLVLNKVRNTSVWLATTLKSLDIRNRSIQVYKQTQTLLVRAFKWALRTALKIIRLSIRLTKASCKKSHQAILLFIDYVSRKKFLIKQWSIKNIKPRWNKFIQNSRKLLLQITELLVRTTKNTCYFTWKFSREFTQYSLKQLRLSGIAISKATRIFLIKAGIFITYCRKKFWHYAKLFYVDLVKDCKISWRVFKHLSALSYRRGRTALITSGKTIRRAAIFIVFLLNKSWIFFKYILVQVKVCLFIILKITSTGLKHTDIFLSLCLDKFWILSAYLFVQLRKASLVTLNLTDRGFKRVGVVLTVGLYKSWQAAGLAGQGLLIIARYLWQLFIRLNVQLLKFIFATLVVIDKGFKDTGYFISFALIKLAGYLAIFISLLMTVINGTTEMVLTFIVKIIQITGIFLWRALKFLLWSPVTLLDFILPAIITRHLKQYALLIRLDKPIGILLLLWPTLIALWLAAEGWPNINVLLVFVAGVFLMRSAGCAINDYADREIDSKVQRTKSRPLAAGKISVVEALIIFVALSVMAFMLVLLMNGLTITMSFIGLALAASYPFMKRYHYLPQIHLGAAFGWAVPMAFAAQANELAPVAWLLFFATVLWATAYDTMYAMVDREDDILIGAKSTAILFEDADTLIIGIIQATLIICLIMIGVKAELGGLYFLSVLIATGFAAWQQFLIKDRQPSLCFKAFMNNNWFGLVLFVGVFLEYQVGSIAA